jgi:hypothetical protein
MTTRYFDFFDQPSRLAETLGRLLTTPWMAMFALDLMRIALELAQHNAVYEDIAGKFFEHFLRIAQAMTAIGPNGACLWDVCCWFRRGPDGRGEFLPAAAGHFPSRRQPAVFGYARSAEPY